MSKKSFTIFVVALVAVLIALGWYFLHRPSTSATGGQTGSQSNPFPFGEGGTGSSGNSSSAGAGSSASSTINLGSSSTTAALPRLRHVSMVPSAGAIGFDVGTGSSTSVTIRYVETATGHVYQTPSESLDMNEVSAVTIPKIEQALWTADGSNVVMRFLGDDNLTVRTFLGALSTSSAPEKALAGSFLPDGVNDISVYGSKIFYLDESMGGGATGIRANIDGSSKTAIFTSSFGDWAAAWKSPDLTVFSRPSGLSNGAAYVLSPSTGSFSKVVDGDGIVALLSADETRVLYSASRAGSFQTSVKTLKDGTVVGLGVATLADKCVWSVKSPSIVYCAVPRSISGAVYPDDWYKGKVSFDDTIWQIDTSSGTTSELVDPGLVAGASIDAIDLSLDKGEQVLTFINKDDMTVWRYDLVPQQPTAI